MRNVLFLQIFFSPYFVEEKNEQSLIFGRFNLIKRWPTVVKKNRIAKPQDIPEMNPEITLQKNYSE